MYEGDVQFKEGARFKKGTLLYYIDDTELRLNIQAQRSNFLRDLATILPDLKIDYNEAFDKWSHYFESLRIDKSLPVIPKSASRKEKTFLATKNIYASYYNIKSAEANLRKFRYYATFNGSITTVNLQSGSYVNPGNNIGKVLKSGALEMKVAVETTNIQGIQEDAKVKISSNENQIARTGRVTRIGDVVNPSTQSVDVFITIYPNGNKIYDSQYLQASIPAETIKNGMVIPRGALYNDAEVFVLQDTLLKRKVVTILRINEETAVFNGLTEGEDLVVEPLIGAHNNMKAYKLETKSLPKEEKRIYGDGVKVSAN